MIHEIDCPRGGGKLGFNCFSFGLFSCFPFLFSIEGLVHVAELIFPYMSKKVKETELSSTIFFSFWQ